MGAIDQVLEATRAAIQGSVPATEADLSKAAPTGYMPDPGAFAGLNYINMEPTARILTPIMTPLLAEIPRVDMTGKAGIQANWRAIVDIDVNGASGQLGIGHRGEALAHRTSEFKAAFRGIGLDNFVNFEAQFASDGFVDSRALALNQLLQMVRVKEEEAILGGNTSLNLGTSGKCPTPTVAASTGAGTVTEGTLSVKCVALGFRAANAYSGANQGGTNKGMTVSTFDPNDYAVITKTNLDASVDTFNGGVSQVSDAGTATIDSGHRSATMYVTAVPGACAYAWYASVNSGTHYLMAVTQINSYSMTADPTTTTVVGANLAANRSCSDLDFDGLLTMAFLSAGGSYIKAMATGTPGTGTKLTSDGAGGITEFSDLFQSQWDNYRLSPETALVSAKTLQDISDIVVKNGGAPLVRFNTDASNPGMIQAGASVGQLWNKITNKPVKLVSHPNMPKGMVLFRTSALGIPYPLPGIANLERMLIQKGYYAIEWPLRSRRYEYGEYVHEVLQHFFMPALSVIYNIAPGA